MKLIPRTGDLALGDVSADDACAAALEGPSWQVEPAQSSADDLLFEDRLLDMALWSPSGAPPDSAASTRSSALDIAATSGPCTTSGVHVCPGMDDLTDDDLCLGALEALAREVNSPRDLDDELLDLALRVAGSDRGASTISTRPSIYDTTPPLGTVTASGIRETMDRSTDRAACVCLSASGRASSTAPESLVADKYRLLHQLGEGPSGRVWVAVNESTSRSVALKFLRRTEPRIRGRILRESLAFGGLQHRNVIDVHDVVETRGGDLILVMPLLAGETLGHLLGCQRRLDSPVAARIARDLALALASLHAANIVLRGLTPSSIFLQREPVPPGEVTVKLLDFDIGDSRTDPATGDLEDPSSSLSAYKSPELMAATDVDSRTDIWSLGIIMFEMLTGQAPFRGDTGQITAAIQQGEAPPVSQLVRDVAPGFVDLVSACLQRDRARRPSLLELADGLAPLAGAGDPTSPAQRRSRPPPDRELGPSIGSSTPMLPFFGSSAGLPAAEAAHHDRLSPPPAAGSRAAITPLVALLDELRQSNDEIQRSRVLPGEDTATFHQTLAQSRRVSTIVILITCSVVSLLSITMVVGLVLYEMR